MIYQGRSSWQQWLAVLSVATMTSGAAASAQTAAQGMSVTGYSGSTAMVQDPPGSPWRSVSTASLPDPAPVSVYQHDEWVEINDQGRPIRISIMSVTLVGEAPPPDIRPCPTGQAETGSSGVQGSGGC